MLRDMLRPLVAVVVLGALMTTASAFAPTTVGSAAPVVRLPYVDGDIVLTQGNGPPGHVGLERYAFDWAKPTDVSFAVVAARAGTVIGRRSDSGTKCRDANHLWDWTYRKDCWALANYLLIDVGGGYSVLYLHLAKYKVYAQVGDKVRAGDRIAMAGTTGWSSAIHLHFQVERTPSATQQKRANSTGWWFTQSVPVTFAASRTVPATPSNIKAIALDSARIQVTWADSSNNEQGFVLSDNLTSVTLAANTTSYVWGGLAPNTYKCFHVYAYNSAGSSAWAPGWACTTTPAEANRPPNPPALTSPIRGEAWSITGEGGVIMVPCLCFKGNGDPDGDAVTYKVLVTTWYQGGWHEFTRTTSSDDCHSLQNSPLIGLELDITGFFQNSGFDQMTFSWHVNAFDEHGAQSDDSTCWNKNAWQSCFGNSWWENFTLVR